MDEQMSFGDFLQQRRSSMMRQKVLAEKLGITVSYLCEIENGRKDPPQYELVVKIADVLNLKGTDREKFFDLAGKGRNEVSPDLPEYIMNSDVADTVRMALRTAKSSKASVQDWLDFVQRMQNKSV